MARHPVKKIFGLTILYSIIIIGIFVLQFKNESVISRNIGLLRMSVAQTQNADGSTSLKNTMQVSFKGISFTADDVTPATLLFPADEPIPLTLISWEQSSDYAFKFLFTNDVSLSFAVSDTDDQAVLTISAQLPPTAELLSLTYSPASGYSISDQAKTRQILSAKNAAYVLNAPAFENEKIVFSKAAVVASYTAYEPSTAFTFASVPAETPLASQGAYEDALQKIRNSVASISAAAMQDISQSSESTIVAYVAELASRGRYNEAIGKIPDSFRRSSRRTYMSAPYFNSLVSLNQSLTMVNENMGGMIRNALSQKSLDIFDITALAEYMLREDTDADVRALAALPASLSEFAPSVDQATGILHVYTVLAQAHSVMADWLTPVLQPCIEALEDVCAFENDMIVFPEKDTPVPFVQALETGKALLDYGLYIANAEYETCGRLIITSAFAQNPDPDTRTLAEIYPLLVDQNPFYPHYAMLGKYGNSHVWAWTAARSITYEENATGRLGTITIDFPQNDTHYLILKGIRPFDTIEIYGLSFHTDPRFENYNSSGYVYNEQTQTLFLKSRHKSEKEVIHLAYKRARTASQQNPRQAQTASQPARTTTTPATTTATTAQTTNATVQASSATPATDTNASAPASSATSSSAAAQNTPSPTTFSDDDE